MKPTDAAELYKTEAYYLGRYRFKVPAGRYTVRVYLKCGWPRGFKEGEIVAVDAAGNRAAAKFWFLNAPRPGNCVEIAKDGCYWQAGKRIFPLGIYEVKPNDMPEVKAAGFEVVHTYTWEGSHDEAAAKSYLDAAQAAGLRVFIGFDRDIIFQYIREAVISSCK